MQRVHWHVHAPGSELFQDYGLGLDLERLANGRVTFGHGGGFPGQITRSMADPASGLVVAVLTNCADGPAAEMARGIFKVLDFFEHHPAAPRARWRGLEGRYANLWGVSDFVGAGQTCSSRPRIPGTRSSSATSSHRQPAAPAQRAYGGSPTPVASGRPGSK